MSNVMRVLLRESYSQLGNARRFVGVYGDALRYCEARGKWLVWDGSRWSIDDTGEVERRAKATVDALKDQVRKMKNAPDELVKHALRSHSWFNIKAMIGLACTEPLIPVKPNDLDRDPYLLNCQNGTVNLSTGKLRKSRREDLITKLAPVVYDPHAACPEFEKFLNRIMGADAELVAFLQRCFGYALTGDVTEKATFFLHGGGDNGKTTLLEAIRHVLGDYAGQIPIDSLMTKKGDGGVPNDIAQLNGRRFVTSSEGEQGKRLAEAKLKLITGMGKLQARFLFHELFEFEPTFKIFIDSNHKPEVRGTDNAIWNRLKLIPFDVSIPKEEQDKHLLEKLKAEAPGILNWAVRGCSDWKKNGLNPPTSIQAASAEYRDEMDTFAEFLESETIKCTATTSAAAIYSAYRDWCRDNDEEPISQKAVGMRLTGMGYESRKLATGRAWAGIQLKITPVEKAA
jgi:putative DNA primase/helicase